MVPARSVGRSDGVASALKQGQLDIAALPGEIAAGRHDVALVVDVLRATTTIAAMLDAGALGVCPVGEIAEAFELREIDRGVLLAGERGGVPPAGFDLGNSPTGDAVARTRGRRVALSTTNGTRAALIASGAAEVVAALSLTNLDAVGCWLGDRAIDALVVCSGTDGERSLEDELAAGLLAEELVVGFGWELTERAAKIRAASLALLNRAGGLEAAVRFSSHADRLIGLGLERDVVLCSGRGTTMTIPRLDHEAGLGLGMFVGGYHS